MITRADNVTTGRRTTRPILAAVLFSLTSLLVFASATTLHGQVSGSGFTASSAAKPKPTPKPSPTPTPAPTPFADDVLQWNPAGSSSAFSSSGNTNWYDVTTSTSGVGPGGATTFNTLKFVGAGTNSKDAPTAMSVGATTSFSSLVLENDFNATNTTSISNNTASNFIIHVLSGGDLTDNASSGTVTFTTGSTGTLKFDLHGPATVNVASGATIVMDTPVVIENASASTGSITKSGAGILTLAGANTYTGGTSISAGTLKVTNTTGSATGTGAVNFTNASGTTAILSSGVGTTGAISGLVTTNNTDSTVRPGGSGTVGALTLSGGLNASAGATFNFDLGSNSNLDLISLSSGAFIGPTALNSGLLKITFSALSGVQANTSYQLFTYGSNTNLDAGDFAVINSPDFAGAVFTVTGTEVDVTFTAVPEPSTWFATGLAIFGVGFMQRRRLRPLFS